MQTLPKRTTKTKKIIPTSKSMYAFVLQTFVGTQAPNARKQPPTMNLKNWLKLQGKKSPEFTEYKMIIPKNAIQQRIIIGNL
jgi:hypothetical protein